MIIIIIILAIMFLLMINMLITIQKITITIKIIIIILRKIIFIQNLYHNHYQLNTSLLLKYIIVMINLNIFLIINLHKSYKNYFKDIIKVYSSMVLNSLKKINYLLENHKILVYSQEPFQEFFNILMKINQKMKLPSSSAVLCLKMENGQIHTLSMIKLLINLVIREIILGEEITLLQTEARMLIINIITMHPCYNIFSIKI